MGCPSGSPILKEYPAKAIVMIRTSLQVVEIHEVPISLYSVYSRQKTIDRQLVTYRPPVRRLIMYWHRHNLSQS